MPTVAEFKKMFSMPSEPETALGPGQWFDLAVPQGKKALITDVYVENLGGGRSKLLILEQRGPDVFEVRYTFRTAANQVTVVNFATGLKLGDKGSIAGNIRIENAAGSQANVMPRVNGVFVP
jgi:hypothetical protein